MHATRNAHDYLLKTRMPNRGWGGLAVVPIGWSSGLGILRPDRKSKRVGTSDTGDGQMAANLCAPSLSAGIRLNMLKISDEDGSAESLALKIMALPPSLKRLCSAESDCNASKLRSIRMNENRSIVGPKSAVVRPGCWKCFCPTSVPFRHARDIHPVIVDQSQ